MATLPVGTQLLEYLFYYPPDSMSVDSVQTVAIDQYDMVSIEYTYPIVQYFNIGLAQQLLLAPLQNAKLPGLMISQTTYNWLSSNVYLATVAMTPQAFVNWYVNNRSTITSSGNNTMLTDLYNKLMTPTSVGLLGKSYPNAEAANAALVQQNGWLIVPATNYTYVNSANYQPPATFDGQTVYALLAPNQTAPSQPLQINSGFLIGLIGVGAIFIILFASKYLTTTPSRLLAGTGSAISAPARTAAKGVKYAAEYKEKAAERERNKKLEKIKFERQEADLAIAQKTATEGKRRTLTAEERAAAIGRAEKYAAEATRARVEADRIAKGLPTKITDTRYVSTKGKKTTVRTTSSKPKGSDLIDVE